VSRLVQGAVEVLAQIARRVEAAGPRLDVAAEDLPGDPELEDRHPVVDDDRDGVRLCDVGRFVAHYVNDATFGGGRGSGTVGI